MRILIVDDDQKRLDAYRQKYRGQDVALVRNYSDAVRRLTGSKFDLVSLDYDIADHEAANQSPTGRKRTGLDLAHYIAENLAGTPRAPVRCVIHSHNVNKAPVMQDVLEQSGIRTEYQPY
jgi:CheY-like chemotaxis protein